MLKVRVLVATLALIVSASSVFAQKPVVGTWDLTTISPEGEFKSTLVIREDSPEPATILFMVEGGLVYLDKAVDGGFAAYEDGFTALELCRNHYREAGLDVRLLDALVR